MGQGVQPGVDRKVGRQTLGQRRVVDHDPRQHPGVGPGGLTLVLGHPPDVGRLRPREGGGHRDDRQPGVPGDDLGEPGGRAAADGDDRVRVHVLGQGDRIACPLRRHVLDDLADVARDGELLGDLVDDSAA